jgi:uncharacterized membrane protein YgcG
MRKTTFRFLAAALLLLATTPVLARSLEIVDFGAKIEVDAGGEVRVEERITVAFRGSWNGLFREIPYGYTYPSGVRGKIRLTVDAVEDDGGKALEYWETRKRGRLKLKIRVPGARDAERTVVVRYHAVDVIRRYKGSDNDFGLHDELYWNVTGNDWQVPIHHASAEVRLPAGIPDDAIRAVAFTGTHGARGDSYELQRPADDRLVFNTTRGLAPHSGLTIVVGLPPGHVEHPSVLRRAGWLLAANWFTGVPFLLFLTWLGIWWQHGRDPVKDRTIIPEWQPPMGLRPSEVGVLIDDRMDQRDLTASIFDLAVRGVLTIRESDASDSGQRDFVLILNEQALDGAELETFEEALIDGLFGGKSEVTLGSLKRKFFKKVSRIYRKVLDDLVVKGLFRARPDKVQVKWILLTLAALVAVVVVGIVAGGTPPFWVVLALCAPPMFILAWKMPQRTTVGLDALAHIKGMEEYLVTAERDRMEQLPLHQVETLLPYAIALNLHDRWAEAFAGMFERPPQWYEARDGYWAPGLFGGVIGDVNRSVTANLYSVPRTASSGSSGWGGGYSGGSGFSGGGSAGGGFGGGGGGGW